MNKKDIVKITLISLIVVSCILVILLLFSREYILHSITVTENNVQEKIGNVDEMNPPTSEENIEEIPIESPIPSPEPTKEIVITPGAYYIKVNTQMNTVTVYTKDEDNNYTIPVKAMICSTGEATPQNTRYMISGKRWKWRLLFGNVQGQYTTHINDNILFHSVPYKKQKKDTLEYWEYDKLGTTCSLGCIRLKVEDAKWIYDNCLAGSYVEFYSDADPGPLGKPTAMKISDYEEYRNWDPTDSDENNPWNNIEI